MKTYKIHFIRNGMTAANVDGRYIGHTDEPLSEQGKKELFELSKKGGYPDPQAVFVSPLARCAETAAILFPEKKPVIINDLIEYNFGEFEGKTAAELHNHPLFSAWLAGEPDVAPPFGESAADFSKRIMRGFSGIVTGVLKTGITETAIVTHGGVIAALLANYGLPELPLHEWFTSGGCGYTVSIMPSVWTKAEKVEITGPIPERNR